MTDEQDLVAAVRARTEGTPYALTETEQGFNVGIDVADASWYALAYKQHLSKTWVYHVKFEEGDKTLSITDHESTVDWRAGIASSSGVPIPVLSASRSTRMGRWETKGFQKTFAIDEQGHYAKVVDFTFASSEGRDLIRGPAQELGWTEKRGAAERAGLYVGLGTTALLVLAGIVVGIVALAGGF